MTYLKLDSSYTFRFVQTGCETVKVYGCEMSGNKITSEVLSGMMAQTPDEECKSLGEERCMQIKAMPTHFEGKVAIVGTEHGKCEGDAKLRLDTDKNLVVDVLYTCEDAFVQELSLTYYRRTVE